MKTVVALLIVLVLTACSPGTVTPEVPTATPRVISGPIYKLIDGTWFTDELAERITDVNADMLLPQTSEDKRFIPANNASEFFCNLAFSSKFCHVEELTSGDVGWVDRAALGYETPPDVDASIPRYKVVAGTWLVDNLEQSILEVYKRMLLSYTDSDELFIPADGAGVLLCQEQSDPLGTKIYCLVESLVTGEVGWVEKKAIEPVNEEELKTWDPEAMTPKDPWTTYVVTNDTRLWEFLASEDAQQEGLRDLKVGVRLKPADDAVDISCVDDTVDGLTMKFCKVEVIDTGEIGWVKDMWILPEK